MSIFLFFLLTIYHKVKIFLMTLVVFAFYAATLLIITMYLKYKDIIDWEVF